MRGEPKKMLKNYKESSAKLRVTSMTFQRVKVPLGRIFQGYSVFCRILRATPSQGCEIQTSPSIKGNSLKFSKPQIPEWFEASHSFNSQLIPYQS
jgi:hypothetical protein